MNNNAIRRLCLIDETWKYRIIKLFPSVDITSKYLNLTYQQWTQVLLANETTSKFESYEAKHIFSHYDLLFNINDNSIRSGLTSYEHIKNYVDPNFDDVFHDVLSINIKIPTKLGISGRLGGIITYKYKTITIERVIPRIPITLGQVIFDLYRYFLLFDHSESFIDTYYRMLKIVQDGIVLDPESNSYQVRYQTV